MAKVEIAFIFFCTQIMNTTIHQAKEDELSKLNFVESARMNNTIFEFSAKTTEIGAPTTCNRKVEWNSLLRMKNKLIVIPDTICCNLFTQKRNIENLGC